MNGTDSGQNVDTRRAERRSLHLHTTRDLVAEIERLVEADRTGRLRQTGNWSLGTALGHVAAWMGYAYDGYPAGAAPPWFVRIVARLFKRRFLRGPMMAGIRIPRVEGGTFGVEDLSTEEGAARLRTAMERLEKEAPPLPSPVLGHLTHEQWIRFNLAHAELHLGFFGAEDDAGNTG